jgi:hypothetical protein
MPTEPSLPPATDSGSIDPSANEEWDDASPTERFQRAASLAVSRSEYF